MSRFSNWFNNLSNGGRIAVVSAGLVAGISTVSAIASPTTPTTPAPASAPVTAAPEVRDETVTAVSPVPFPTTTVSDSALASGTTRVNQEGVDGEKTTVYKVTYTDGKETGRVVVSESVTKPAVEKIIANGTYVAPKPAPRAVSSSCDPNYSGCVPVASDVDCAGGSGNGPAYTSGPVQVIGSDIYGLDRDGDGWGCD